MTPEERLQKLQKLKELRDLKAQQAAPVQPQQTPAEQFAQESPVARTIGRTARTGLTGLAQLADLGLLVPKTAALAGSLGAEKMGLPKVAQTLAEIGATPTMGETTKAIIDQATGNRLQDINGLEKAASFVGETIASAVPFSKVNAPMGMLGKASPPTAGGAVRSMLDPEYAIKQVMPEKTTKIPLPKIKGERATLAKTAIEKYNIPLNVSDISESGVVGNIQRASQAVPLAGEATRRANQLSAWNKAVSGTFGQSIENVTPEAIDNAFKTAGEPFNFLNDKIIKVSKEQLDELDGILDDAASNIEEGKLSIIKNNIDKLKNQVKNGEISGRVINDIRSVVSANTNKADPTARPFLSDVVNKIVDISVEGNPEARAALNEARKNYKNLNVALGSWDSTTNSFNPVKLETSVKSARGYGLRNYARGRSGDIGELAKIGKTFLQIKGGSPTAPIATSVGLGTTALTGLLTGNLPVAAGPAAIMAGNRLLQSGINRNPSIVNAMLYETAPLLNPAQAAGLIGATGAQGTQMIQPPLLKLPAPTNSMLRVQ